VRTNHPHSDVSTEAPLKNRAAVVKTSQITNFQQFNQITKEPNNGKNFKFRELFPRQTPKIYKSLKIKQNSDIFRKSPPRLENTDFFAKTPDLRLFPIPPLPGLSGQHHHLIIPLPQRLPQ